MQEAECIALNNLAQDPKIQLAIASDGGIEAVVKAMGAHQLSVVVQQAGCSALTNLAAKNSENRVTTAANGGIEAVERAMRAHQSIVEVQEAGCGALRNFVLWGSGMGSRVREADAVALVKKDLSAFPYTCVLQTRGFFLTKQGTQSLFWIL